MTTLVADDTIVESAVARLTDLYRNKAVERALVETLAERFAHEDEVELELYTKQWIDAAEGALLDAAGELVGEPRQGRSDDLYRLWIRARVRINRTQGKIRDSYHLVRLIAGEDVTVHYIPTPPAAYIVTVDDTDVDPAELFKLLNAVRPAGVRMSLEYSPDQDLETLFTLSETGSTITGDNDKGLGDVGDPDVGGRLRGVL
jgi:hypothetical protein